MKTYWLRFGYGDPRTYTGLAPTLVIFKQSDGTAVTAPSITEIAGSGIYSFQYGTTTPIAFLADAATTSPGPQGRYVVGNIDPSDRADEYGTTIVAIGTTLTAIGTTNIALGTTNVALGTTNVALGTTAVAGITLLTASGITVTVAVSGIGSTTSSFGDSSTDPVDLFGYLKRITENLEGNQSFVKSSGVMNIYSRGSSTLLRTKTIANSSSMVVKT